ncbi:type II/IV secretion system protein [Candidatus Dojkabacteria bacterium]|uniref:Type II/IV secretion system protein n=1 Tax=Candidatus Dojkabacteria bacterium TaxID=2099670 RepID=A0A847D0L9_9BACT|nr:type II/IV secretion system protein [Candidatus Dojkabacteria bacterium]
MIELLELMDDVLKKKINISDFLDALILDALKSRASDIHIESKEDNALLVRYRVDGVLRDTISIGPELKESLLFIIKVRAKLRTDVHLTPQDGKIPFEFKKSLIDGEPISKEENEKEEEEKEAEETKEEEKPKKSRWGKDEEKEKEKEIKKTLNRLEAFQSLEKDTYNVDARVSILPVTFGEKVVIRLLTQANKSYSMSDLGFSNHDLEFLEKSYRQPYGLILITGPTGSGKTTTLYSILKILNTREVNITTIEDPVEYSIDGVNHIQINVKSDLTFATGLRSILRQDPNVIMVGEIRDTETARITVNSALTGHLVLSTLHANDSVSAIPRLVDMGIEPFLIASTLNIVVAQRLARRLCKECKKEYVLEKDEENKELLKLRPDLQKFVKPSQKLYKAVGCEKCNNTGYSGRVGIYELLYIDKPLRDTIISNPSMDAILTTAKKGDFKLMVEDAVSKLTDGMIDIKELIRVIAIKD